MLRYRLLRRTGAATLLLASALALTACTSQRSPQAFCKVYWQQKHDYLARYGAAAAQTEAAGKKHPMLGVFSGLVTTFAAIGDIEIIFDKLDRVAPDDIEPDVAKIRDSLKSQTDSAGGAYKDPIGTVVGGLVSGLTTVGSWQRVSEYVVQQCGEKG